MTSRPRLQRVPLPTHKKFRDLFGQKFHCLRAVEYVGTCKGPLAVWRWVCDCGSVVELPGTRVVLGRVKSCGCLVKRTGLACEQLYGVWMAMNGRCHKVTHKMYKHYGARGIQVHAAWRRDLNGFNGYRAFKKDVGLRPSSRHSIDRIDNDGNYEPSNVRWATKLQQMNNMRKTKFIFYDGRELPLSVVCRTLGINPHRVRNWVWRNKVPYQEAFDRLVKRV